jgi:hypothetical protein
LAAAVVPARQFFGSVTAATVDAPALQSEVGRVLFRG